MMFGKLGGKVLRITEGALFVWPSLSTQRLHWSDVGEHWVGEKQSCTADENGEALSRSSWFEGNKNSSD